MPSPAKPHVKAGSRGGQGVALKEAPEQGEAQRPALLGVELRRQNVALQHAGDVAFPVVRCAQHPRRIDLKATYAE